MKKRIPDYSPSDYDLRLEARDITAEDHVGTPLLRGVSLDIGQGEYVSIEGETGAGKSLFVTALVGIKFDRMEDGDPDDVLNYGGTIRRTLTRWGHDEQIELPDDYNIRKRFIGFVPQDHNLIGGMTAEDNIRTPQKLKRKGGKMEIDETVLDYMYDELNIRHLLDRKANNLSGGEKQRISIARGFASGPRFVVLDEPTANLHGEMKAGVSEMFGRIVQNLGVTVISITHDEPLAWRRIKMADGKIMDDDGAPDDTPTVPEIHL